MPDLIGLQPTQQRNAFTNPLLLKSPRDFEPVNKKVDDFFVQNRSELIVILSKQRLRKKIFQKHVHRRFKTNFINQASAEKTREIVLESQELTENKSYKFLKEMNLGFNQLSKNEIIEICSQVKLLTSDKWTYFCYKTYFFCIGPKIRKIYLHSKKRVIGEGSRVFRIKAINKR